MRAWLLPLLLAAAACGRLGYSELCRAARSPDAVCASADDGQVSTDDLDGGGDASHAPDAQVSTASPDSSAPREDAGGLPASDGGYPELPRDPQGQLDCSAIANSLACETFAQGIPVTMEARTYGGTVQGTRGAVEASTDAGEAKAVLISTFSTLFSGQLYVRYAMYLTSSAPLVGVNFLAVTDSSEPWPDSEIDFNAIAGPRAELFMLESGSAYQSEQPLPLGQWTCVEILIGISEQAGSVQLSFDGQLAVRAEGIDTRLPLGLGRLSMGVDFTAPTQGPATVRIDDLVVSTEPYRGCN